MNTNDQAKQLRLAADIIKTGHPWEHYPYDEGWLSGEGKCPIQRIANNNRIRLALAEPPYPAKLHNPDNPTAEQVGAGYRLALDGEETIDKMEVYRRSWDRWEPIPKGFTGTLISKHHGRDVSIRLQLSTPWPKVEEPDPCAELKGIKPEPAFTLPTPPPGMQWHRLDGWKEGDLPRGWRPHVSNEHDFENDESRDINSRWVKLKDCKFGTSEIDSHRRTTRPLVFTHAGKAWTWHRAGDPMPCMPGNLVELVFADIMQATGSSDGYAQWGLLGPRAIIGWRYASTTREVELGPEDVRCGDEILNARGDRRCITGVFIDGISLAGEGFIKYVDLKPRKIRRRDSDTFEPCSKEVAV